MQSWPAFSGPYPGPFGHCPETWPGYHAPPPWWNQQPSWKNPPQQGDSWAELESTLQALERINEPEERALAKEAKEKEAQQLQQAHWAQQALQAQH
jgi:hypothetical protein